MGVGTFAREVAFIRIIPVHAIMGDWCLSIPQQRFRRVVVSVRLAPGLILQCLIENKYLALTENHCFP